MIPVPPYRSLLFTAGALAIAGLAALAIDMPAARWFAQGQLPGDFAKALALSEAFAHGFGVLIILLAVWLLDVQGRSRAIWLAACSLGAGLTANALKLAVARVRPHAIDLEVGALATFDVPLRLTEWSSRWQSFPSSHTATAVGLAVGLSWLYPRGRPLFVALAVLAAVQRIASLSHFVSDVMWGAAIGVLASTVCLWTQNRVPGAKKPGLA